MIEHASSGQLYEIEWAPSHLGLRLFQVRRRGHDGPATAADGQASRPDHAPGSA